MSSSQLLAPLLVAGSLAISLLSLLPSSSAAAYTTEALARPYTFVYTAEHLKIGKTPCKECHDDKLSNKNVHPPASEGCDTCHEYKEKGESAEMNFTMEVGELCGTCHPDQKAEVDTKKFAHAPAKDLGCVVCHNPHSSQYPFLLRAEPTNLCFACHKLGVKQQKTQSGRVIVFPETSVPADYPDKAKKIPLGRDDKGHPFIGHPVSGTWDLPEKGSKMSCTTCHNPHAGNYVQMFQKDLRGQALCDKCHK